MNLYDPIVYRVTPEEDGVLLRTILTHKLKCSRKLISRIKNTEHGLQVNGIRQFVSAKVSAGDLIEVYLEEEESEDILPQHIPIQVIFEDEYFLIVNKPAGMIVHPTHGHYLHTLANAVMYYWQQAGKKYRFRPIHRLDQETSGVLAIAKNAYIHQQVSQQLISHQVSKKYHALVWGQIQPAEGVWDGAIDRSVMNPHKREVTPSGYSARTLYRVLTQLPQATLIECTLETGRTHQIRVHATHSGHPLIGDKLYTLPTFAQEQQDLSHFLFRHALHASKLGFFHPMTKQPIEFHAEWPADFLNVYTFLQTYRHETQKG